MAALRQRWITYAENDEDGWKCVLLARSLKRTLTTRPMVALLGPNVSKNMELILRKEFEFCSTIQVEDNEGYKGLGFRSVAKLASIKRNKGTKFVFLDCNCMALANCDELFGKGGIDVVTDRNFASLVSVPKSMRRVAKDALHDFVINYENQEGEIDPSIFKGLEKIRYCTPIYWGSQLATRMMGSAQNIICFVDGHPLFSNKGPFIGEFEKQLHSQCYLLCTELFSSDMDYSQGTLKDSTLLDRNNCWELNNSIAIVGMACNYPGAENIDEFWQMLAEGREGMGKIPEGRWNKENSFIIMDNVRDTEGGFLKTVDKFDAKFFNINPADAKCMDPQQRLSLKIVWEGLEHAGIDPNTLKNSLTGVFGGWWRNDYKEMLQYNGIGENDFLRVYMGNALGPLTARISHFFEFIGPAFSTESGCSTSVAGVDMACDSLRNEQCNVAIAIGANLLLHPFILGTMEGVLARDGRCKTFDVNADGFGRAEGFGVLVLKRLPDAIANKDRICGIIRGSAIVQEGISKSMGTPTVEVESKAMELALERAGVDPDDVDFVEMHGTGTPVGDPIEVAAVAKAYGGKGRVVPLTIGSVKTNIGHTESVCGIAGIQKTLLSMQHELIPKHLNLTTLSPDIDLASIPAQLPMQAIEWKKKRDGKPRIAGVNSFGITGAQAHVVLQEPPEVVPISSLLADSRSLKLFTFSAKTEEALKMLMRNYDAFLQSTDSSLSDIEFSMHTGRPHLSRRASILGESKQEVLHGLTEWLDSTQKVTPVPPVLPKICFLFSGQGSQYPEMAFQLYNENVVFRSHFNWCDALLKRDHGVLWLKDSLWDPNHTHLLKTTLYSQVSIFVVEYCLLKLWGSWGIRPDAVLGHSLGEFAAAVAAGMMKEEDALGLVVTRSKLIDALPPSSMMAVALGKDDCLAALDRTKWLDIAAVNSPEQTVVAGETGVVEEFQTYCNNNNVKTHVLESSHAFHSKLMDPILESYKETLSSVKFFPPSSEVTFISSVEGRVVNRVDVNYWIRHTRESVKFVEASHAVLRDGQVVFLEVGPHPVLSTLLSHNTDDEVLCLPSLRKKHQDWKVMLSTVSKLYGLGCPIVWENFHRFSSHARKVDLPGYPFEETHFWMGIKNEGSTPFHPLVGAFVPNPSDLTIFRNILNVNRTPFLKDHAVGDKILFPCAGYVDMIMTAGYAASHCPQGNYAKPSSVLSVQNFGISSPVILSEMQATEFQVVVGKNETTECKIFTKLYLPEGDFKWVENAKGTFSSVPPSTFPHEDPKTINLSDIQTRTSLHPIKTELDYDDLKKYGFNFGPSCRTVEKGWMNLDKSQTGGEFLYQFASHETQENLDRFIIHPWVTDPMLQLLIISMGLLQQQGDKKKLVVPVQMEHFIWWGLSSGQGYVYIKHSEKGNEAHVLSLDGGLMASMINVEFMETTVGNIVALVESQRNPFPALAEYAWKEKMGPMDRRIAFEELKLIEMKCENVTMAEEEESYLRSVDKLSELFMLKAMAELGLEASRGDFQWQKMAEDLGVIPCLHPWFHYMLRELAMDGWLKEGNDQGHFTLLQPIPSLTQLETAIALETRNCEAHSDLDLLLLRGPILSQLLTGKKDILKTSSEVQFPSCSLLQTVSQLGKGVLDQLTTVGNKKTVIRILEVYGDKNSSDLITFMKDAGASRFEYTYTGISPSSLEKGEEAFKDSDIPVTFSIFDPENSPLEQGFLPNNYELIIASVPPTGVKNMERVLGNLRRLLRKDGILLLTTINKANRYASLTFGHLWTEDDDSLERSLVSTGFELVSMMSNKLSPFGVFLARGSEDFFSPQNDQALASTTWLVFGGETDEDTKILTGKLEQLNIHVRLITHKQFSEAELFQIMDTVFKDQELNVSGLVYMWGLLPLSSVKEVCEPFLYISKYLNKGDLGSTKVIVFTKGHMCTGPTDFGQSHPTPSSPLVGMVNALINENLDLDCRCVDIDGHKSPQDRIQEAMTELFSTNPTGDVLVAYRGSSRCTPRLRPFKVKSSPLTIPQGTRYRLILPPSHLISDLHFAPCEPSPFGDDEIEVEVKAYALNFLDVFMVTKPDPVFNSFNYVGVDFAGVVTAVGKSCQHRRVGDRVFGARRAGFAMPSHLTLHEYSSLILPDNLTFADGATYPMAVLTSARCLVDVAKIQPRDTVLIHTASGGVGLMAIQLAQRIGCRIVATAGNERKRAYLKTLGVSHVFNSRTTEYGAKIREALGGRGVDVVLNSLTSSGFKEATLDACEPGARFIEMSKMNVWSKEEVGALRPDVFYEVVDVSLLPEETIKTIFDELSEEMEDNIVCQSKPLPYIQFDLTEVREALEYMEKVKHIGKIVVTPPSNGKSLMFHPNSTYCITGGLGGIGMEVASWMAGTGACNLLLLGRSPPSSSALEKIKRLSEAGVRVEAWQCDVGEWDQVSQIQDKLKAAGMPQLRGLMHCAGVLVDATLENQSWEKFEGAYQSKLKGACNMHELSLQLRNPLEFFVVFSSMTSTIGSVGQSNYTSANYYLDALVHYRNSIGLPGTTINWGQWGQVGMVADVSVSLFKPFTIHQGLSALEYTLKSHRSQVLAYDADLVSIKRALPAAKGLLAEIEEGHSSGQLEIDGDEFWKEYDACQDRGERLEVVRKFMKRLIRTTLKMDKNEEIDENATFQDMGMDSLMMVEMKNGLQASVGKRVRITINAVKDCKTVTQLTERLVDLISGKEELPPPTKEELREILRRDSVLPDHIVVIDPHSLTPLSEVSNVLLLGATGTLGVYILRELLNKPSVSKVTCLMRPNPLASPKDRLRRILEEKKLYSSMDMDRVDYVIGDVRDDKFGLSLETYDQLMLTVEAVFNLTVKVDFAEVYRDNKDDHSSTRVNNLHGMANILQFAVEGKLKHVYHASTIAAQIAMDEDGRVSEAWPKLEQLEVFPNSAYPISKVLCDLLAQQAVERGVPVKVFRFPYIGGDSGGQGGNFQMETFHVLRFLGYMYLGAMPAHRVPFVILPVDQCAQLSLQVFFNEDAGCEVYNVFNPHVYDEIEFADLASQLGVKVEPMEPDDFVETVSKKESSDEIYQLVKYTMKFEKQAYHTEASDMPIYLSFLEGNKGLYASNKLKRLLSSDYQSRIPLSEEVLRRDLLYCKDNGIFDRYNIKYDFLPSSNSNN